MKVLNPILGLLLASLVRLPAQVSVEVTLDQDQFLPGEALIAVVKIKNRSGQTLHMGREPDWLTFSVESRDGFVVGKSGDAPVIDEFILESSQVATKRVDVSPYFAISRPGRYGITATIRIKEWDGSSTSPPKHFDIIDGAKLWSQDFGVPTGGGSNQPPEVRRYTLQQANYLRTQLRLYFRLTDDSGSRVFKVFPLGPLVSFSDPKAQVDRRSNLHVLYQSGARTFSYTVLNPDGDVVAHQTYDFTGKRPRLQADQNGDITVAGGVRRVTKTDIPAPTKKDDEPKESKP